MTDKQIIIDGVDVSKCEHNYDKKLGEYSACNLYPPPLNCKRHPNCLFKQLARKTQECVKLRTDIKEIAEICSFTDSSELLLKRIKLILQNQRG